MSLTISYAYWHRGKAAADRDAYLYNSETDKYDVLGIILTQQLGLDKHSLHKLRLPSSIAHQVLRKNKLFREPFQWIVTPSHTDTEDTLELIKINDDPFIDEATRETRIRRFLTSRGVEVMFTNSKKPIIPRPITRLEDDEDDDYEEPEYDSDSDSDED